MLFGDGTKLRKLIVGLLKDLFAVVALIATLAGVAWVSRPPGTLSTLNCTEFAKRLAAQQDHDIAFVLQTHLAKCTP